jgi:hypothetical protein
MIATKGKRVKPRFPIEYRILIMPIRKEREKEIFTLVAIRTVNEFTNFRYEIVVQPVLKDKTLHLAITGLRAPQVTIPGTGPATFTSEFRNLGGTYNVIVSKPGRDDNHFSVKITDTRITIESVPKKKFVEIVTDEAEW